MRLVPIDKYAGVGNVFAQTGKGILAGGLLGAGIGALHGAIGREEGEPFGRTVLRRAAKGAIIGGSIGGVSNLGGAAASEFTRGRKRNQLGAAERAYRAAEHAEKVHRDLRGKLKWDDIAGQRASHDLVDKLFADAHRISDKASDVGQRALLYELGAVSGLGAGIAGGVYGAKLVPGPKKIGKKKEASDREHLTELAKVASLTFPIGLSADEFLKQAGFFSRMGGGAQKKVQSAKKWLSSKFSKTKAPKKLMGTVSVGGGAPGRAFAKAAPKVEHVRGGSRRRASAVAAAAPGGRFQRYTNQPVKADPSRSPRQYQGTQAPSLAPGPVQVTPAPDLPARPKVAPGPAKEPSVQVAHGVRRREQSMESMANRALEEGLRDAESAPKKAPPKKAPPKKAPPKKVAPGPAKAAPKKAPQSAAPKSAPVKPQTGTGPAPPAPARPAVAPGPAASPPPTPSIHTRPTQAHTAVPLSSRPTQVHAPVQTHPQPGVQPGPFRANTALPTPPPTPPQTPPSGRNTSQRIPVPPGARTPAPAPTPPADDSSWAWRHKGTIAAGAGLAGLGGLAYGASKIIPAAGRMLERTSTTPMDRSGAYGWSATPYGYGYNPYGQAAYPQMGRR